MPDYIAIALIIGVAYNAATSQSIQSLLADKIDIVVSTDNSGDFKKIQDAINSIPDNNPVRKVLFLKKGKYVEKIVVPYKKTNITLVGENVDSTIISYNDASLETIAMNTFTSYTFRTDADDFEAMNITIENTATSAQAVALHGNGDRQTFLHCRVLGWQDTYFNNIRTRNYFKDCFMQGAVDYLFGFGIALFDSCIINTLRTDGYLTAAATSQNYKFGFVFSDCRITSQPEITSFYLGRPWFAYARTVFLNCWENSGVNAEGWKAWKGREDTCYYREYKCTGPGSGTSGRVYFGKQLTEQESRSYVMDSIFARSAFPQGADADTFETNTILRRFQVSTTPNMVDIAQAFLKCGRDTFPSYPALDWRPKLDTNSIYQVIKSNTVSFFDTIQTSIIPDHADNSFLGKIFRVSLVPVQNRLDIHLHSGNTGRFSFAMYDLRGKKVLCQSFIVNQGRTRVYAGSSTIAQGVYFYTARLNGTVFRGRIELYL